MEEEQQFQRLTILAFPRSSLVQSLAVSHREFDPVCQYEGVTVSIEYIERDHRSHLQCYRPGRNCQSDGELSNGASLRSRREFHQVSQTSHGGSVLSGLGMFGRAKKAGGDSGTAGSKVLVKEKKAATQLGVIVGAFIFCWLPYFILFMVVAYCDSHPTHCTVPFIMEVSTTWCGYLNSTLNPILYPLCNRNFKIAFKRMLRMSRKDDDRTLLTHK